MSIIDLKRSKELKKLKLSREYIAERALEICKQATQHGGYKNAIATIGRMQALSQAITDSYWQEKKMVGYDREYYCLMNNQTEIRPIE